MIHLIDIIILIVSSSSIASSDPLEIGRGSKLENYLHTKQFP